MKMGNIIELTQSILRITPQRWNNLVESVPAELLTRQPQSGEWSAIECLQHMIDVEAGVFRFRTMCFLEGKDKFPAFFPDDQPKRDLSDFKALADEFARLRAESLPVIAQIKLDDLKREAVHGELGVVTLEDMLNEWAAHDLNHLVQAERALMQPFIQNCGAWQSYFADHDVTN